MIGLCVLQLSAGCSLFVDENKNQCHVDGDCARFGSPATCVDGVCVASGAEMGVPDLAVDSPDLAMTSPDLATASPDLALGPPGCFGGVPSQPSEFLNACTAASCLAF